MLRPFRQQVPLASDVAVERGHQFLADIVQGRVGDLGEELLEVGEEGLILVGEDGGRGVVAHRTHRIFPVLHHRLHEAPHVLPRVAKGALSPRKGIRIAVQVQFGLRHQVAAIRVVVHERPELDSVFVEPPAVLLVREAAKHLVLRHDAGLVRVREEELARLKAVLPLHALGGKVHDAGLAGHHEPVVVRHPVATGAQAVAVEHGADAVPVGERHEERPVPRLDEGRVVVVPVPPRRIHLLVLAPRLRDQHPQGVGERPPGLHQQFEHVVEHGRVALRLGGDGPDAVEVVAEHVRLQVPLPRPHPVEVAAERVHLPVVDDAAEGMGQAPGAQRVRGEARVDEGERGSHAVVGQLRVVGANLLVGEEPFVDDLPPVQRAYVENLAVLQVTVRHVVFDEAPEDVELRVEGAGRDCVRGSHEELPHVGLGGPGRRPQVGGVCGHVTPGNRLESFGPHPPVDEIAEGLLDAFVRRQKELTDAVRLGLPEPRNHVPKKRVGLLDQDARPVAGVGLGPTGAPVVEAFEYAEAFLDHRVAFLAVQVHEYAHAAVGPFATRSEWGMGQVIHE